MATIQSMPNHWAATKAAPGLFTPQECDRILALRDTLRQEEASTANFGDDRSYRESRIGWLHPTPETQWIFEKTAQIVKKVNEKTYRMDLSGFGEPLQLASYAPGQHYDWHTDFGTEQSTDVARKLSFIVQLSPEDAYQGGAVQVRYGPEPMTLVKTRGTFIVFPAYVLHRVQPVTAGERLSLVGWMAGPPFR